MEQTLPYLIAFVFGALFSVFDVLSIKYRKISTFIYNSISLYAYAVCFGVFGTLIFGLLRNGLLGSEVFFTGMGENIYIQAAFVGIFTKAFFDIKIFSFSTGQDKTFPVGIKTISHFIEEPLLSKMEVDWFKNYSRFIKVVEGKYQNQTVNDIHNLVVDRLQNFPDDKRVVGFIGGEFDKVITKRDKYSLVMREFGKEVFCQIFDC